MASDESTVVRPAMVARRAAVLGAARVAVLLGAVELYLGLDVTGYAIAAAAASIVGGGWEWVRMGDALTLWREPLPLPDRLRLQGDDPARGRTARMVLSSLIGLVVLAAVVSFFGGDGVAAGIATGAVASQTVGLVRVRLAERRLGLRLLEGSDGDGDPVFYRDSPRTAASAPPRTLPGIPA